MGDKFWKYWERQLHQSLDCRTSQSLWRRAQRGECRSQATHRGSRLPLCSSPSQAPVVTGQRQWLAAEGVPASPAEELGLPPGTLLALPHLGL